MRHFSEVAAMILAAFVFLTMPVAAEEKQQPKPRPVVASTCSHQRWLDPIADCRYIPDGPQRNACGHLALQINATCGFSEPVKTAQR